jgi:hypothetical protein
MTGRPLRPDRQGPDERTLASPHAAEDHTGGPPDGLRLGSYVSAGCATLIVLSELLVTDLGLSFGASAIASGGRIFTWTIFAIGAVGCGYLGFRFLSSALAAEHELSRFDRGSAGGA